MLEIRTQAKYLEGKSQTSLEDAMTITPENKSRQRVFHKILFMLFDLLVFHSQLLVSVADLFPVVFLSLIKFQ